MGWGDMLGALRRAVAMAEVTHERLSNLQKDLGETQTDLKDAYKLIYEHEARIARLEEAGKTAEDRLWLKLENRFLRSQISPQQGRLPSGESGP